MSYSRHHNKKSDRTGIKTLAGWCFPWNPSLGGSLYREHYLKCVVNTPLHNKEERRGGVFSFSGWMIRTLLIKLFECEALTGDGRGGTCTVHYNPCQGVAWVDAQIKGCIGEEWIQDGMVRAGSRGMNNEDIVDQINILLWRADRWWERSHMHSVLWSMSGGWHKLISRSGGTFGRSWSKIEMVWAGSRAMVDEDFVEKMFWMWRIDRRWERRCTHTAH